MTETSPLPAAATIGTARAILRRRLNSGIEADCLLCRTLACARPYLYAHPETVLAPARKRRLETLLQRRLDGVPLAYLTGVREFFSLEFEVTPAVLIPRPETETLVEIAIKIAPGNADVLDLGTGCGTIAVALARARPDAAITACDNSRGALAVAIRNAQRLGASNVSFVASDWFEQLPDARYDVIVANPPYVRDGDPDLDPAVAAYEPTAAVVAQDHGLADLRRIIGGAPARLRDGGALAVEHGHTQAAAVAGLMHAAGFSDIHCAADLAGRPRVSIGTKRSRSANNEKKHR